MNAGQALVLGLVQGLTEFLPISSSGHLVIFQEWLGVGTPGLLFEVMVHFGTLLAVVAAFWRDILDILRRPWHKMLVLILVGTVPAGLMGLLLEPVFSAAFESLFVVGAALLVTGLLLWWAGRRPPGRKGLATTSLLDALAVGFGQGLAITPGLSRSGTTIAFALLRGMERQMAFRYSFLLSIPAVLGANLWEARSLAGEVGGIGIPPTYWLAVGVAAISGYVAIRFLLAVLTHGRLYCFSYYCWLLGGAVLLSGAALA
ncbi:MAG: undecaprenyl-diphosphate phosphatase [Clostridia bacterium]|nr:undecaprenyl-diphosphate phosphatase [Clostridia bacterium]MDH7572942.1 undecaprenyl-diphosphate phosphatase [Clostridia bacterium]